MIEFLQKRLASDPAATEADYFEVIRYSFFDFFTQYPDMNKKSLIKLKNIVKDSNVRYVCTGHSGIRTKILW